MGLKTLDQTSPKFYYLLLVFEFISIVVNSNYLKWKWNGTWHLAVAENLSILTSLPTLSPTEPSFCCLYCLLSLGYIYTAAPPRFHTFTLPFALFFSSEDFFLLDTHIHKPSQNQGHISNQRRVFFVEDRENGSEFEFNYELPSS